MAQPDPGPHPAGTGGSPTTSSRSGPPSGRSPRSRGSSRPTTSPRRAPGTCHPPKTLARHRTWWWPMPLHTGGDWVSCIDFGIVLGNSPYVSMMEALAIPDQHPRLLSGTPDPACLGTICREQPALPAIQPDQWHGSVGPSPRPRDRLAPTPDHTVVVPGRAGVNLESGRPDRRDGHRSRVRLWSTVLVPFEHE